MSDWRDISSHYIQLDTPKGPKLIGYQANMISELNKDLQSVSETEYMIRYISKDP